MFLWVLATLPEVRLFAGTIIVLNLLHNCHLFLCSTIGGLDWVDSSNTWCYLGLIYTSWTTSIPLSTLCWLAGLGLWLVLESRKLSSYMVTFCSSLSQLQHFVQNCFQIFPGRQTSTSIFRRRSSWRRFGRCSCRSSTRSWAATTSWSSCPPEVERVFATNFRLLWVYQWPFVTMRSLLA